ncbi:MAG: CBS domain-containing protein [Desulfomonilaceae bacterium]
MGISQKVKDIMIPLGSDATIMADAQLSDAIQALRKLYCEVEEGKCTEAGFRTILVSDRNGRIVGILDFHSVIKMLIPEIAGDLPAKIRAIWDTLGAVDPKSHSLDKEKLGLRARIAKNAEKRVGDVMLKIRGSISVSADILEALMVLTDNKASVLPVYDGDQLVGVVRDSDLFLKIADMLRE